MTSLAGLTIAITGSRRASELAHVVTQLWWSTLSRANGWHRGKAGYI